MKSTSTHRFWRCYDALPTEVRKQAKRAYRLFAENPYYPSLHFKRIHSTRPIFSVRINIAYRSIGIIEGDEITWFWIGSHPEYETLIKKLRSA
jgi:hypothetical protein